MSLKHITVVIVTFNNTGMLKNLLKDLAMQSRQADEIIVVDNGNGNDSRRLVRSEFTNVKYIHLPGNSGSGGGFYTGIKTAMGKSDGIWTLDDDVRLETDSLKNLLAGYDNLSATVKRLSAVRSVGAGYDGTYPTEIEIMPWRGTLWAGNVVREMGPPRADYFLYGEDLEYSLRMREAGYTAYWVPQSRCIEARHEKTDESMFGKKVAIYPSSFRLYYAFRSESNIFLQYRRADKMAKLILFALKVIIYLLIRERTHGSSKIAAILTGFKHGLQGKLGKNSAYTPS